jgi:hypothetical protein
VQSDGNITVRIFFVKKKMGNNRLAVFGAKTHFFRIGIPKTNPGYQPNKMTGGATGREQYRIAQSNYTVFTPCAHQSGNPHQ